MKVESVIISRNWVCGLQIYVEVAHGQRWSWFLTAWVHFHVGCFNWIGPGWMAWSELWTLGGVAKYAMSSSSPLSRPLWIVRYGAGPWYGRAPGTRLFRDSEWTPVLLRTLTEWSPVSQSTDWWKNRRYERLQTVQCGRLLCWYGWGARSLQPFQALSVKLVSVLFHLHVLASNVSATWKKLGGWLLYQSLIDAADYFQDWASAGSATWENTLLTWVRSAALCALVMMRYSSRRVLDDWMATDPTQGPRSALGALLGCTPTRQVRVVDVSCVVIKALRFTHALRSWPE